MTRQTRIWLSMVLVVTGGTALAGCAGSECAPGFVRTTSGACGEVVSRPDGGTPEVFGDGGIPPATLPEGIEERHFERGPLIEGAIPTGSTEDAGPSCIPEEDPIDLAGADTNCDGVDGVLSESVFVSPTGSDMADGSPEAPIQTIARGLEVAERDGKKRLLIAAGTYEEAVVLRDGISLIGGYRPELDWARAGRSILEAAGPVIRGESLSEEVRIESLDIRAADAAPGESSVALALTDADRVVLVASRVQAGRGGDGAAGLAGEAGSPGTDGRQGRDAAFSDHRMLGVAVSPGGAGGTGCSVCAQTNDGGEGGPYWGAYNEGFSFPPGAGSSFRPITVGISAGACLSLGGAAAGTNEQREGGDGARGDRGEAGADGAGGAASRVFAGFEFRPRSGRPGRAGEAGGTGGGGGGGFGCITDDSTDIPTLYSGSGGGGGGGAGCGGRPGEAGTGGGASVAVVLIRSNLEAIDSELATRGGGQGGDGRVGGEGGVGGDGGSAGTAPSLRCEDGGRIGSGGDGGDGGAGGYGGDGGGGAGGPSFGVVTMDGSVFDAPADDVVFELAAAGIGGQTPGGSNGQPGEELEVVEGVLR